MKVTTGLLVIIVPLCFLSGCSDRFLPSAPTESANLLTNGSFEYSNSPSLNGWYAEHADTMWLHFSRDVPSEGGSFSITVDAIWGPPISIVQSVSPPLGMNRYQLSAWSKVIGVGGSLSLSIKKADTLIVRKLVRIVDTVWTNYVLFDTLLAESRDSLIVKLSGGFSQLRPGKTFFDLCKLEKLD